MIAAANKIAGRIEPAAPRRTVKREGWVNINRDGDEIGATHQVYATREEADAAAGLNRVAVAYACWEE